MDSKNATAAKGKGLAEVVKIAVERMSGKGGCVTNHMNEHIP